MKITWIGHSCFKIEKNGSSLILDPYADGSVPGYLPLRGEADLVLCSHEHADHNGRDCVEILDAARAESVFSVETIETYHDDAQGTKRGPNTIHIISDGTERIAHMGDLGCELTPEQKEKLAGLDLMLIPVGGFFTIDAAQAADIVKELAPKHVIPMHFRNGDVGYDVIGPLQLFTERMDSVTETDGSMYDTAHAPQEQVVVLTPQNV